MLFLKITDKDLPTLPIVASQALELINRENVTNSQIEELIRMDPALTQRLLTTANSPFYSGRFPIKSISDSISRMGLRQLRNLVLVAATGELFSGDDPVLGKMWKHSIASAIAAHKLAGMASGINAEEAFIGGMLHDVGKVVLYRQFKELYSALIDDSHTQGTRAHVLEEKRFQSFTHMSVGGMVIKKWKLSDQLADAASFHHSLETGPVATLPNSAFASLVSLASVLVNNLGIGTWDSEEGHEKPHLDIAELYCLQDLKLDAARVEALGPAVLEQFDAQMSMLA